MKKKFFTLTLMLLVGILIFTGCGFSKLKGGPAKTDAEYGNGKLAVQKGNYLYYVNGYISSEQVEQNGNKFGDATFGAIYRAELDQDGNLLKDEDGNVKTEVLAPKIVGTENTNIFVFGDKIYYASPNAEKDSSGNIDYKLTEFYRSNINGSDRDRVYKTEVSSSDYQYAFYNVDGNVVLVVFDSTNLYMIDCADKEETLIAENVSDVALPKVYEISSQSQSELQNVYYTRTAQDDDHATQGNILCYATLQDKTEVELKRNATYKVLEAVEDYVIYTKQLTNSVEAYYYMVSYQNKTNEIQLSLQAFENTPMVLNFENGNYRGMIYKNSNGYLTHIKPLSNGNPSFDVLTNQVELTPLAIYDDYVFAYSENNELYRVNYKTKQVDKLSNSEEVTLDFSVKQNFDFDGKYAFVYQKLTGETETGIYLVKIDTLSAEYEVETLANVLEEHQKTQE